MEGWQVYHVIRSFQNSIHKEIWSKNPQEVIYGKGEEAEDDDEYRCPFCISRIDEFGYCACKALSSL
jgi:hypothetical protein